jgi:hypothetical protein
MQASGVTCSTVRRILPIVSVSCMVALTAGCSTGSRAARWTEPSAATAPSARPAISPHASTPSPVAKVTAACPLLSTDELKALLGGANSQTKVTAVEQAPDIDHGFASYECKYGSGGKYPFDLVITATSQDFTPREGIDSIAKGSHVVIHNVTGVGKAGTFFTNADGNSLIAVAKVSHGQTRTVIFSAPAVVPERNFISLAKLVLARI